MRLLAILLAVISLQLQGCATAWEELRRDPRDAPWDPKPGSGVALIDQLPAWEGAAHRRCAGHLTPERRRPDQTGRC